MVPWEVDVDTYVEHVHANLRAMLQQAFPVQQAKPRQALISERSWEMIRGKHARRRVLPCVVDAGRREMRAVSFEVWRNAVRDGGE